MKLNNFYLFIYLFIYLFFLNALLCHFYHHNGTTNHSIKNHKLIFNISHIVITLSSSDLFLIFAAVVHLSTLAPTKEVIEHNHHGDHHKCKNQPDSPNDSAFSMSKILDGKAMADEIRNEVRQDAESLFAQHGIRPCLATVIVGLRPDSATYVRMKIRACDECGLQSVHRPLPEDASEDDIVSAVSQLNADETVHGILVQLPLPSHVNERTVLSAVSVEKDVDGFHALNMGNLALRGCTPLFVPCTPRGCVELLRRAKVPLTGANVVVIGRSNIVGLPVALLLMQENATVTVVHSHTKDLPDVVKRADIVVAAVGKTEMVKASWLKPGCVVVDVGINSKPDSSKKRGYRLVGDVDFDGCKEVASLITPVPGGVGPMTIAMVIRNCTDAAMRKIKLME